ncbi:MAG: flagellar basal body rod protein FlgB [Lachnospiraceae bacterium]|nr:flagellar basal body rod protein FlgB [Lachnospiraceae bacterium]
MINTGIYNYIDVLDRGADAAATRNTVLSNNIANVDTPNYKRKDVAFNAYLEEAMIGPGDLDERVAKINTRLEEINCSVYTDNVNLSYRADGNNVDISTENVYLAENQIRYNALVDSMNQEFSRISTALGKG